MKVIASDKETVTVEFKRAELLEVNDIVYTVDTLFESIDPVIYQLTEEKVSEIAKSLSRVQDEARRIL